jgi:hypothetical protein
MACLELVCAACEWHDMSNKIIEACPKCGTKVRAFFDEIETGGCDDNNND